MSEERTVAERGSGKNRVEGDTASITVVTENGQAAKNGDAPASGPPSLPGYEIMGLLGRGAKGVVYQARQLQLNRLVAVKMILAGPHASVSDVLRFMGEAEAVANLHHPNIVQIYDVSQHDGLPYFVLEYVDGGSLQQKLRGAPIPPNEAAQLLESLARATHAAHQAGIVHRDLKPGNVLLTRGGQPKITDFGLAKRLEPGNSLTGSKDVLGTPSYMAPEQADGLSGKVGPPSDVYALGAIFYELLTGRPPFRGVTTMDTLRQVVSEEPVPPRRLQPKVPSDLETICLKALTKEPSRRYATAEDLAEDLRRYARHEPIKARPAGTIERLWRWSRRNPVVAGLISLTVFSVVLGFILVFKAYRSESWERYRAEVRLADTYLQKGTGQCSEEGNLHVGMLWMARGLRHIPPSAHELDHTIRMSMATWGVQLHQLEAIFQAPANDVPPIPEETPNRMRQAIAVTAVAYSPDGKYILSGAWAGFEARLWDVNGGEPIRSFFHGGPILAIACSPDSRYVVTGSQDSAKLWEVATGKEIHSFVHGLPVFSIAFSADGTRILTGSGTGRGGSGEVCLWDGATGTLIASFPQKVPVRSIAFHPGGRLFATAAGETVEQDNTARVWDIETKTLVGQMRHRGAVYAVAFSPDGNSVVTAGDTAAYLWNTSRFEPIKLPLSHKEAVTAVAFSPNGKTILTGSRDRTARAWDATTCRQRGAPLVHKDEVFAVAWGPDNQSVVVGCRDGTTRRWRLSPPKPRPKEYFHDGAVLSLAFGPNDERLAIGCQHGVFDLWNAKTGAWILTRDQHQADVINVRFSASGKYVLTVSHDQTVRVWDPLTGNRLHVLKHADDISVAIFSPDERFIATACRDGCTRLWETESGNLVWESDAGAAVRGLAFHPSGEFLVTGDANGKAHRRATSTGEPLGPAMEHNSPIESIAINSLGQNLLVGCTNGTVRLWNLDNETSSPLLPAHRVSVNIVTFSPDGQTALTCSTDGLARLWTVSTRRTIGPPLQHQRIVLSASFSPDGKLVAIGSQDHKAYVWSAETGKPVGPPIIHKGHVSSVAFNSTGRTLLTGSSDRVARITELPAPIEGAAALVELELAVLLGAELDDTGGLHFLSADEWKERCTRWNAQAKR